MLLAAVHQVALVGVVVVIHHAALPGESIWVIVEERFIRCLLTLLKDQSSIHLCDESVTEMEALLLKKFLFERSALVWRKLRNRCGVARISLHHRVVLGPILGRGRLSFRFFLRVIE